MKGNRFFLKKGDTGCLLVHGLTSSTEEMGYLADSLYSKGYSVLGTLLKGHNTSPENLAATKWQDWYWSIEKDFDFLRMKCSKIYVIGLSVGATLSLHLAANKPHEINGLVLLAPAIFYVNPLAKYAFLLKHFKKYKIKNYRKYYPARKEAFFDIADESAIIGRIAYKSAPLSALSSVFRLISVVKREIRKVKAPTLIIHSLQDHTIKPKSSGYIYNSLSLAPENKRLVYLKKSGHVITVDFDKETVVSEIINFIENNKKRHSPKIFSGSKSC